MNNDKRIEKNKKNIINIHDLLLDINKNPQNFNTDIYKKALKSQNGLSNIENKVFNITKSSINTLKRIAPLVLSGGFEELDSLRLMAYNSICAFEGIEEKSNKKNKIGLEKRVLELENEIDNLRKSHLLMINAITNNLKDFESISVSKSDAAIKSVSTNAIKRLNSFSMLSPELIDIKSQQKIVSVDFKKDVK